ncbi:hypothetical protein [Streptomyces sp. NBC_01353]|uniref:hypothetical protein n=1 Tax=Streptomyces sp. NBC_01353 TaxID=2903835 RepID=UPI002E33A0C2|nr:hypothetical protein [Streptomyces sp. NBC_01353]
MSHVTLQVSCELMEEFGTFMPLLGCTEVSRDVSDPNVVTLTLDAPMAPAGASSMTPWFHTDGSQIGLSSIEWFDATGARIWSE